MLGFWKFGRQAASGGEQRDALIENAICIPGYVWPSKSPLVQGQDIVGAFQWTRVFP